MVAWMNGHTDRYKAYVCHAGCFDWVAMFADDVYVLASRSELGAFYWDDSEAVEAQNPRATSTRHEDADARDPRRSSTTACPTRRASRTTTR